MRPLGIYSWFGYDIPFEKRLEMIAGAGFTVTGVWFGEEENLVRTGRSEDMPAMVAERSLALDNIHAPFWNANYLWSESEGERQVIRQDVTEAIMYCGRHHVSTTVMHVCSKENPPSPNKAGLALLQDLVKLAEDQGVIIALENLEYSCNLHLDYVFSSLQSPNLGFCYDSSHDNIAWIFRKKALEKWGHLLATTHISDNLGLIDDHFLPGKGNINWPEVMKQIPKSYRGSLSLEVDNPEAGKSLTPEDFLKTAYERLSTLAKHIEVQ
jgi:sugar phosphate isomerase/epimerase